MITATGMCRFCGQNMMVEMDDSVPKGEIQPAADEAASLACTCRNGSAYREEKTVLEQCRDNIREMFGEKYPQVAEVMLPAIEAIWNHDIKRIVISTPDNGVAALSRQKGDMVIKWTRKTEVELSTAF